MRVATLNVHGWFSEDGASNAAALCELLTHIQPLDVLGLQEVLPEYTLEQREGSVLEQVAAAAGLRHICWHGRMAILSRYPVHSPVLMHHCQLGGALCATIGSRGKIVVAHERQPWHRLLCVSVTSSDEAEFVVATCHLDHVSETTRLRQMACVLDAVRLATRGEGPHATGTVPKRCVILGDFNALTRTDYTDEQWSEVAGVRAVNQWEAPTSELTDMLRTHGPLDCWSTLGFRAASTCRFNTRIDYVFANRALLERSEVVSCEIVPTRGATDHELVVAEFRARQLPGVDGAITPPASLSHAEDPITPPASLSDAEEADLMPPTSTSDSGLPGASVVVVVGAGAAGLAAARALLAKGLVVLVFEQSKRVGGLWVLHETADGGAVPGQPMYGGLRTNLPCHFMAFSDYSFGLATPLFPGRAAVLAYLERYAATLPPEVIRLGTAVTQVPPPLLFSHDLFYLLYTHLLDTSSIHDDACAHYTRRCQSRMALGWSPCVTRALGAARKSAVPRLSCATATTPCLRPHRSLLKPTSEEKSSIAARSAGGARLRRGVFSWLAAAYRRVTSACSCSRAVLLPCTSVCGTQHTSRRWCRGC